MPSFDELIKNLETKSEGVNRSSKKQEEPVGDTADKLKAILTEKEFGFFHPGKKVHGLDAVFNADDKLVIRFELNKWTKEVYPFSALDKKYIQITCTEPVIRIISERGGEDSAWALYGPHRSMIAYPQESFKEVRDTVSAGIGSEITWLQAFDAKQDLGNVVPTSQGAFVLRKSCGNELKDHEGLMYCLSKGLNQQIFENPEIQYVESQRMYYYMAEKLMKGAKKYVCGRLKLQGEVLGDACVDVIAAHVPSMDIVKIDPYTTTATKGKKRNTKDLDDFLSAKKANTSSEGKDLAAFLGGKKADPPAEDAASDPRSSAPKANGKAPVKTTTTKTTYKKSS